MNLHLVLPIFFTVGLLALVAFGLMAYLSARKQHERREAFIRSYTFPSSLRNKLSAKYPSLTAPQLDMVFRALRQYFLACLTANVVSRGGSMGMPSRVTDDLWHEFMLVSREYANFCQQAFGGFLHHTPDTEMKQPIQIALGATLRALKPRGSVPAAVATIAGIPLLFAIDKALAITNGFHHDANTISAIEQRRDSSQGGGDGGASFSASCGASGGSGCADGGGGGDSGGDGGGCGGGCG
jgi:hypothetical protein